MHRSPPYSLWLAENVDGYGLEPRTHESMLEPRDLPAPGDLVDASVDADGALVLAWANGKRGRAHPGWLRHVAEGGHLPAAVLPEPTMWTGADFAEPPTLDGGAVLHDDAVLEA